MTADYADFLGFRHPDDVYFLSELDWASVPPVVRESPLGRM
jgi:hypothetical protein